MKFGTDILQISFQENVLAILNLKMAAKSKMAAISAMSNNKLI